MIMEKNSISYSGNSMLPLLKDGDKLFIESKESPFKIGDIVVFKENDEVYVHRLIDCKGILYFKGDRVMYLDETIPQNTMGILSGFHRENIIIFWGREGHFLKTIFAKLSIYTLEKYPRIVRFFSRRIMIIVNFFVYYFYFLFKKTKKPF